MVCMLIKFCKLIFMKLPRHWCAKWLLYDPKVCPIISLCELVCLSVHGQLVKMLITFERDVIFYQNLHVIFLTTDLLKSLFSDGRGFAEHQSCWFSLKFINMQISRFTYMTTGRKTCV